MQPTNHLGNNGQDPAADVLDRFPPGLDIPGDFLPVLAEIIVYAFDQADKVFVGARQAFTANVFEVSLQGSFLRLKRLLYRFCGCRDPRPQTFEVFQERPGLPVLGDNGFPTGADPVL